MQKSASLYSAFSHLRTFYALYSVKMRKNTPEVTQMCATHGFHYNTVPGTKGSTVPEKNKESNSAMQGSKLLFERITYSGRIHFNKIQCFFLKTRGEIANIYQQSLPATHATLAFWVVFGYESTSSDTLIVTFRRLGISDMVVASGYQVTFMSLLVSSIFSRKRSLFHIGCRVFLLWCYVCIVGFQASILRAALSRSLLEVATGFGKKFQSGWALFLSGAILLLIKPVFLFSLGFQFSFLISAAFILFSSREEYAFSSFFAPILAWYITLPLEFARGESVFLSSILAEMALLWTCPVLITSSVIHLIVAWIPGINILSTAFLYMCTTVYLEITQGIVQFFDQIPLEIKPNPMVYTVWLLILVVLLYKRFFQRKTRKYKYFFPD